MPLRPSGPSSLPIFSRRRTADRRSGSAGLQTQNRSVGEPPRCQRVNPWTDENARSESVSFTPTSELNDIGARRRRRTAKLPLSLQAAGISTPCRDTARSSALGGWEARRAGLRWWSRLDRGSRTRPARNCHSEQAGDGRITGRTGGRGSDHDHPATPRTERPGNSGPPSS